MNFYSRAELGKKYPCLQDRGIASIGFASSHVPFHEAVVTLSRAGVLAWRESPYSCGTAPDFPDGSPASPLGLLIREGRHQSSYFYIVWVNCECVNNHYIKTAGWAPCPPGFEVVTLSECEASRTGELPGKGA